MIFSLQRPILAILAAGAALGASRWWGGDEATAPGVITAVCFLLIVLFTPRCHFLRLTLLAASVLSSSFLCFWFEFPSQMNRYRGTDLLHVYGPNMFLGAFLGFLIFETLSLAWSLISACRDRRSPSQ